MSVQITTTLQKTSYRIIIMSVSSICKSQLHVSLEYKDTLVFGMPAHIIEPLQKNSRRINIMSVLTACQSQLYVSLDYKGIRKEFLKLHISLNYKKILLILINSIAVSTVYQPRLQRQHKRISISVLMVCQPKLYMYMHQCFVICVPRDTNRLALL